MDKRQDFGQDLADLSTSVESGVGDVLQVLREKRGANSLAIVEKSTPVESDAKAVADAESNVDSDKTSQRSKPAKPRGFRQGSRTHAGTGYLEHKVVVNVTTRLRPETNDLLTQASLHQKLKNVAPDTRQDIVEEALQDWFRKHSYAN